MTQPLISIIVPVYNVEQYLPHCIESITNQTHQELEIILINDGSTDSSGEICDRYAAIDARVRVNHQKNAGVGVTRNIGLDRAKGEWIGFVDSDDWIVPEMYSKLLNAAIANDVRVAACGYVHQLMNGHEEYFIDERLSPTASGLWCIDNTVCVGFAMWNLLIHRSILENGEIRFDIDCHPGEDALFSTQILLKAGKIAYVPEALYNYLERKGSSMTTLNKKRLTEFVALKQIVDLLETEHPHIAIKRKFYFTEIATAHLRNACTFDSQSRQFVPQIKKEVKRYFPSLLFSSEPSIKWKIKWLSLMLFPFISSRALACYRQNSGAGKAKQR